MPKTKKTSHTESLPTRNPMDRLRLNTLIEKEVHKLMFVIKEHVYDFVHLYVMRNKLELDRPTMLKVLEIVKTAMDDGFQSKIDGFNGGISKALDEFTEQENPTIGARAQK